VLLKTNRYDTDTTPIQEDAFSVGTSLHFMTSKGQTRLYFLRRITMRLTRLLLSLVVLTSALAISFSPARADGIIIPEPPICEPGPCPHPFPITQLAIEYHHVQVTIKDQVVTTHVDQVFRNDNDWQVEGTYIFPIPEGASIGEFILWVDNEPVEGKILSREEAREIYEDIVRKLRDPALLEYVDRGAVQASIFPIPPGGKRRIELEYSQVLTADNGLIHYRYPLNTEKFSTQPLEQVSISVKAESQVPIKAVYSPTHDVSVDREGEYEFLVGYEEADIIPDKDFDLFYSISEEDLGVNLITFRDPLDEDKDGFFLMLVAPNVEVPPDESIAKDVILVLDRSGSMEGKKFQQAQAALKFVLEHLNPEDRFNIITFSTGTKAYAQSLKPASESSNAIRWVDSLSAQGSTDINLALLEAVDLVDDQRPGMVIFLTDGLPTEGEIETTDILENLEDASPKNLRLFAFGVGYDVDTFLLDSLAKEHHGTTTYVTPDQDIDEIVSNFYAKVNDPVLTDLELDFGDIIVYDVYPEPLPDLFAGTQIVVVGRYKSQGFETVTLNGLVNGQKTSFTYPNLRFRGEGGQDYLPRLWATRKIGALLNQVRLQGAEEELIDQIVRLSIRYGIITEYTSFLVTEPEVFGNAAQESIVEGEYERALESAPSVSGMDAVERAAEQSKISAADVPVGPSEFTNIVKVAGSNTYKLADGVWVDTRYDPETMSTLKVPFLSQDYFELVDASGELSSAFALGERVIVISGGIAYEVVGSEEMGDEIILPVFTQEPIENPGISSSELDPSQDQDPASGSSSLLACPAVAFIVGFVLLPIARGKRISQHNSS
jgi:Ca-activated chloride channel family protein